MRNSSKILKRAIVAANQTLQALLDLDAHEIQHRSGCETELSRNFLEIVIWPFPRQSSSYLFGKNSYSNAKRLVGKVRFDKQSWRRLFVASCRELQTGSLCSADQIRPARVGTHRCEVPGERSALNRDEKRDFCFFCGCIARSAIVLIGEIFREMAA